MISRRSLICVLALAPVLVAVGAYALHWPRGRADRSNDERTRHDSGVTAKSGRAHAPAQGYVGSQACRSCHQSEYQTYLATSHSRALSEVVPDREPPDCVFDHKRSGRRYRVTRRDGRLMHEESLLLDDGEEMPLASFPVTFAVGSGHFGKTYLCEADGFLVESPISWYKPRHTWGMSPGYDRPGHKSFTRVVPENCLLCHAGNVETSPENDLKMRVVEESIGCERCHGPGRSHVERQTAGRKAEGEGDDSIVNPQRLSRKLSEAVCQQCHLQGDLQIAGRGVRSGDYRPGLPLEPFRCEFRQRKPESGMTIVGHFEQLGQSPCYRQSETLTCVTCHNPHVTIPPAERSEHFRSVCMSCHDNKGCKIALETRQEKTRNDCVACHMPSSETEIPHVAFTHHRIGIHPLQNEPAGGGGDALVALSDLSVLSGSDRMRVQLLARLHLLLRSGPDNLQSPAGRQSAREIGEALQTLPSEAIDAEVEAAGAEFHRLCGNTREAIAAAERALERDDIGTEIEIRASVVLGLLEFEQGRYADARHWFSRLAALRRDAGDLYHLGLCQNNCGQVEAAIRSLASSCAIDATNVGTFEALALIHHARQELEEEARLRTIIDRLNHRAAPRGD